jgi:hypothetical protein
MTLSPFHSDGVLMNKTAVGGLLAVLHSCFDMKSSILNKRHYLLYSVVTAVRPRCLVTVDQDLKSLPVSVRVGARVDTAGQAGKPRAITGFQTHTTPVLLAAGERAELSDDKCTYYALLSRSLSLYPALPPALLCFAMRCPLPLPLLLLHLPPPHHLRTRNRWMEEME